MIDKVDPLFREYVSDNPDDDDKWYDGKAGAYVISLLDPRDDLYWNKERGWSDWLNATVFTPEERASTPLPMYGAWISILPEEDMQILRDDLNNSTQGG